jgi:radical SAM protein with 4Fe4S-binding SPASM domain
LNFVVTRHNEHEIERFEELAESLGCKAIFSNPSLNVRFLDRDETLQPIGLTGDQLAQRIAEHMDQWLPEDQQYVIEPYRLIRQGHYRGDDYNGRKIMACQWPWKDSVINWNGTVVTCCGVYETAHDMGNVFERPFHEIWNSRAYRLARRSFSKPVAAQPDNPNPCRECPGFMV